LTLKLTGKWHKRRDCLPAAFRADGRSAPDSRAARPASPADQNGNDLSTSLSEQAVVETANRSRSWPAEIGDARDQRAIGLVFVALAIESTGASCLAAGAG
jgi:hypothetical protein